jgi:hypothetical protein
MLTADEMLTLQNLLSRARAATSPHTDTIAPGDVVQLRPGASRTWETSLLLVGQVRYDGRIRGAILRPHRSGCREAWYSYNPAEFLRVGRAPFAEPPEDIRHWCYEPPCPLCQRKPPASEGLPPHQAIYRDHRNAVSAELRTRANPCT